MVLLKLPVELARELLESWLRLNAWAKLDSAYCSKLERSAYLDVIVGLNYAPNKLHLTRNAKADQEFTWCASRRLRMRKFDIISISSPPADIRQFKNSTTASSLISLTHDLWNHQGWALQVISICPNIERLYIFNLPYQDVDKLNEWCPKLSSLTLSYAKLRNWDPFLFSNFRALKRLRIRNTGIQSLTLPNQLEEFNCDGYVDESTLLSAFATCNKLTKVRMVDNNWRTRFPSSEVFHILPPSLTALHFKGCADLSFVLQTFTFLTELTIAECQDISQEEFDGLFRLPAIIYLALECRNTDGAPKIKRLSDGIVCTTLKYLIMEQFECMDDEGVTSMVQRCPALTHIELGDMEITVDFSHLNDQQGIWNFFH